MRRAILSVVSVGCLSCGTAAEHKSKRLPTASHANTDSDDATNSGPATVEPTAVLRGQWTVEVSSDGDLALAQSSQQISGQVAASVAFTVSNSNFKTPGSLTGTASYGSLDVTDLRDNNLRVCGATGSDRCTKGIIRIYSTGTESKGLYSSVEKIGLPILTGASEIGLDAAGAVVIKTVTLSSNGVLKLSDFTSSSSLQVPIAVNFSDAAAGTYQSSMVIEYLLQ